MPKWTEEQELAINESGKNIIVSAGAGSGKTAVLTERVIRKLKRGISIRNLLILTFTNNAAHEMKDRIRRAIKKEAVNNEMLKQELDYIDNAYITTFDSFALSIVKKYHYLLGIGNDISIIDSSIIDLKKDELIDIIFENKYKNKDSNFIELVNLLCVKDDKDLKRLILNIYNKIDLLVEKNEYLDNYINKFYNVSYIDEIIADYEKLLLEKIREAKKLLELLSSEVDGKYYEDYYNNLINLFNSTNYNEIKNNSNISLGQLRNATELGKVIKTELSRLIKEINSLCFYEIDEIKNNILSTKNCIIAIIDIIKELNILIDSFKKDINKYEFNDISMMAINVVKDNTDVREELRETFREICIDEYQDTSDIQETFINLISNNNVYMVGDIKQSIYRFRNANPVLFKNKYNRYSKLLGGIKIDLNKNFRSRSEVLDDINIIFNLIMDDFLGGAEYSDSHNMIFGNNTYINEGKTEQNNNLEIYNYEYEKDFNFKKEEIEAFIIAKDIKNKVDNKYQVFDKDNLMLRDIEYNDFVILMDRSTNFELYKKIFEYLEIPTTLYKDENIVNENELYLIKNIISFIIKVKLNEFDTEFKYLFTSINRSYLSDINDEQIFEYFVNDNFKDSELYKKCYEISLELDNINNVSLLDTILSEFDIFNKFTTVGNVENKSLIIDYLYKNFSDLDNIGYGVYSLKDYFDNIISSNKSINVSMNTNTGNSVKIMTIHKSKGLEYHICYFSGFDKPFNLDDLKSRIIYDNKYGIVIPIDNEGLDDLITKYIIKDNYIKEDISERIRLLYVALTRAKEKMIIVGNFNDEIDVDTEHNGVIENRIRCKYRSFKDILLSIIKQLNKYIKNIDINELGLTNEYNNIKTYNYKDNIEVSNTKLEVNEINVEKIEVVNKHFSKSNKDIINESIKNNMNYGIKIHEIFEIIDLKKPEYDLLDKDSCLCVKNFLNQEVLKNINNAKIYKEYEFVCEEDNTNYHGIIDLMLEYDNHIDIIDYKLMNIESDEYINQLMGYKDYIEKTFNKTVKLYLYSILNNKIKELC